MTRKRVIHRRHIACNRKFFASAFFHFFIFFQIFIFAYVRGRVCIGDRPLSGSPYHTRTRVSVIYLYIYDFVVSKRNHNFMISYRNEIRTVL
nr:MAG TPA: hypothetical protein [Caudoviricetes sp.]